MKRLALFTMLAVVSFWTMGSRMAMAAEADGLFVNLTSAEAHRAHMALTFSQNALEKGHPVTIFLNDKGVYLADVSRPETATHREVLHKLMAAGATVIVCPMCMQHYGIKEADLLPGSKMGNPELTQGALFQGNTKTLSW